MMLLPKQVRFSVLAAAILLSSTASVLAELPPAIVKDMLQRQDVGTDEIAPGVKIADVVDALNILDDDTLSSRFLAAFEKSGDSGQAARDVFAAMTDAQKLPAVHAEAFRFARNIYIENAILHHPRYTEGRLAAAPEDEKLARAGTSFDHILSAIIGSENVTDPDSVIDLATYAEPFVRQYLLDPRFSQEFPQEALRQALILVKTKEETARMQEETARMQEETARLDAEIKRRFEDLIETMEQVRAGE